MKLCRIGDMKTIQQIKRYLFPSDLMADPAVHTWQGATWIYPSHDRDTGIPEQDDGSHFDMVDYHALRFEGDPMTAPVEDCGVLFCLKDVPWAKRQLWDSDATETDGRYYICFSAKDRTDTFRLGLAVADSPRGPFRPYAEPIAGSYSIDPCIFAEGNERYVIFGGLWGGQLQRYRDNRMVYTAAEDRLPDGTRSPIEPEPIEMALSAKIARLKPDMSGFAEAPRDLVIYTPDGQPVLAGDHERRFFEGAWLFKRGEIYYFAYSTGDTHLIAYATARSLEGPFIYQGTILTPVVGWTTHCAITEIAGKWYLFHHDSVPSGGRTSLRSLKVCPLEFAADGSIRPIEGKD